MKHRDRLTITKQFYPTYDGQKPLSWAIYLVRPWRRKVFVAYSWSLAGAQMAMDVIKKTL